MKKNIFCSYLFALIFILMSCATVDPGNRLDSARNNVAKEKYEAALTDYLWFHNNALKYDIAYGAVRRSCAISEWVELGRVYPKALQELKNIRNEKTEKILDGLGSLDFFSDNGYFNLFSDISAINHYLNETEKTVQLFSEIYQSNLEVAKPCYIPAKEDLIKHKKFKICNSFLKDIDRELFLMKSFLDLSIKEKYSDDENYMWYINNYLKDAENIVLILVNNDRLNEAEKFLFEASKDIEENKIINDLKVLKEKYLANQPVHPMPKAGAF